MVKPIERSLASSTAYAIAALTDSRVSDGKVSDLAARLIFADAALLHDPQLSRQIPSTGGSCQPLGEFIQIFGSRLMRQTKDGYSSVLFRRKDQRVRKIQVQRDQATPVLPADVNECYLEAHAFVYAPNGRSTNRSLDISDPYAMQARRSISVRPG